MKRRNRNPNAGWAITFADLMGLLVSFFVMLTVLLAQDKEKFAATKQALQSSFGKPQQQVIVLVPPVPSIKSKELKEKLRLVFAKDATLSRLADTIEVSQDKNDLKIELHFKP